MSKKLSTADAYKNNEMTFKEENGRAVLRRTKDGDIIGSVRIGEGGNAEWGQIDGELKNQTDLMAELDGKVPNATLEAVVGQFTEELERVHDRINSKQNELTAGEGISIEHDVISATGTTTVLWGDIEGNLADQKDLQSELDAKASKAEVAAEKERAIGSETELAGGIEALQESKQHKLQAGTNITITSGEEYDVISASGEVAPTEWGQIGGDIDDQTDLIQKLEEVLSVEAQERQTADVLLDGKITAEAETRRTADTALGGRIDSIETDLNVEISARESEDLALDGKIGGVISDLTLETNERRTEDYNIHTELNGKQRKLAAGTNITITPGDVEDTISATMSSIQWGDIEGRIGDQEDLMNLLNSKANAGDLSDEITRSQGAEAILTQNLNLKANAADLNQEIQDRTAADNTLMESIEDVDGEIQSVSEALSTETTNRTNADSALSTRITTNETNIGINTAAISGLSAELGSEVQARATADTALGERIDAKEDALTFSANYGIRLEGRTPIVEEATEGEITPFLDAYHPITPHNFQTALTKAGRYPVIRSQSYVNYANSPSQWGTEFNTTIAGFLYITMRVAQSSTYYHYGIRVNGRLLFNAGSIPSGSNFAQLIIPVGAGVPITFLSADADGHDRIVQPNDIEALEITHYRYSFE